MNPRLIHEAEKTAFDIPPVCSSTDLEESLPTDDVENQRMPTPQMIKPTSKTSSLEVKRPIVVAPSRYGLSKSSRASVLLPQSARNREVKKYQIVRHERLNTNPVDRVYESFLLRNSPPKPDPKPTTQVANSPAIQPQRQKLGANRFGPAYRVKRRVVIQGTGYQGTARPAGRSATQEDIASKHQRIVDNSPEEPALPSRLTSKPLAAAGVKRHRNNTDTTSMRQWKAARDAVLAEKATPERPKKRLCQELENPSARMTSWTGAGNAYARRW